MALISARFRGRPRLESIAAGNGQAYLRFGNNDEDVRAVQWALIDSGYSIPAGATGYFGGQTSKAVVSFKTDHNLMPNDAVVGVRTITTLDSLFFLELPDADHDEFASWQERPFGDFNFHRKRELFRRAAATPFTFDPISNFVPRLIRNNIARGLEQLLDPSGSPNGERTPAATWGASPLDMFHVHLVVDRAGEHPSWSGISNRGGEVSNRLSNLRRQALAVAPEGSPAWTAAYSALLLAPAAPGTTSFRRLAGVMLASAMANSRAVSQPLKLVWHTFEKPRWRPAGMTNNDPRRCWWQTIDTAGGTVTAAPFSADLKEFSANVRQLTELHFVVHQLGVITVMPNTIIEAAAVVGLTKNDIDAAWYGPP